MSISFEEGCRYSNLSHRCYAESGISVEKKITLNIFVLGIVPGGGVALIRCLDILDNVPVANEDQKKGVEIIRHALTQPMNQIAKNAGLGKW